MAAGEFGIDEVGQWWKAAKWAVTERRGLGVKYKDMTAPKILEEIYRRNLDTYGDTLGPTMKYFTGLGRKPAEIIASSGKPGGADIIKWVVKNTGWDITNWAR